MKYSFIDILNFERKSDVWDVKFKGIPVWYYIRGEINSSCPPTTVINVSLIRLLCSAFDFFKLMFIKNKFNNFCFVSGRNRLVEFSLFESDGEKLSTLFFVKYEGRRYSKFGLENEYDAYFLEFIRFCFRKMVPVFLYSKIKSIVNSIIGKSNKHSFYISEVDICTHVSNSVSEYYFLKFLKSVVISNKSRVLYSCCVIPLAEKFLNLLNSTELQHGVIHDEHPAYSNVPFIINTFKLYDSSYRYVLDNSYFSGNVAVSKFNAYDFSLKHTIECGYKFVVFGGVNDELSSYIEKSLSSFSSDLVKFKKHPRDCFRYSLDKRYFINDYDPRSIDYPIMVDSTVIDDFQYVNKKVYIINYSGMKGSELLSYKDRIKKKYGRGKNISFDIISDLSEFIKNNR